jgi:hypothetical protein
MQWIDGWLATWSYRKQSQRPRAFATTTPAQPHGGRSKMAEDLGKLTGSRLEAILPDVLTDEPGFAEWSERQAAYWKGSPGVHAMLSRAQVRAVLGPLLAHYREMQTHCDDEVASAYQVAERAIEEAARALLGLSQDAASPLDE